MVQYRAGTIRKVRILNAKTHKKGDVILESAMNGDEFCSRGEYDEDWIKKGR